MQNTTGDRLIRYKRLSKDYFFSWGKKKKKNSPNSLLPEKQAFYLSGTQRGVVSIFQTFILET